MLTDPGHGRLKFLLTHSWSWAVMERFSQILLRECGHMLLKWKVLRREEREAPTVQPREIHQQVVKPITLAASGNPSDGRQLAGSHRIKLINRFPPRAVAPVESLSVETAQIFAPITDLKN